jgi:hypothetical protein
MTGWVDGKSTEWALRSTSAKNKFTARRECQGLSYGDEETNYFNVAIFEEVIVLFLIGILIKFAQI